MEAIFDVDGGAICEGLRGGGRVSVPGFGSFRSKRREARTGRNPRTGKEVQIPASNSAGFTMAKLLKDALNR